MKDVEYLTEGKKYVAVTDRRPAQLLPSLLIYLAPFPFGPVPLGAYPMGAALLCTCSRVLESLCTRGDPTGAAYSRFGLTSITKARFLVSLLVPCMVLLNKLRIFMAFEAASRHCSLHLRWLVILMSRYLLVRVNPLERGIVNCIRHIRWCSIVGYTHYLAFVKMKLPSLGPSVQFRKVSLQLGTIVK